MKEQDETKVETNTDEKTFDLQYQTESNVFFKNKDGKFTGFILRFMDYVIHIVEIDVDTEKDSLIGVEYNIIKGENISDIDQLKNTIGKIILDLFEKASEKLSEPEIKESVDESANDIKESNTQ